MSMSIRSLTYRASLSAVNADDAKHIRLFRNAPDVPIDIAVHLREPSFGVAA